MDQALINTNPYEAAWDEAKRLCLRGERPKPVSIAGKTGSCLAQALGWNECLEAGRRIEASIPGYGW